MDPSQGRDGSIATSLGVPSRLEAANVARRDSAGAVPLSRIEGFAMNRREVLALLAAGLAYRPRLAMADAPPPNILLIFSDDCGWPYYGFMGHPIVKTPNLDALATGGIAFGNGSVVAPACQPSHESLLSGLNRRDFDREAFISTYPQLQTQLVPLGYRTFGVGKWYGGSIEKHFTDRRVVNIHCGRTPLTPIFNFLNAAIGDGDPWYVFFAPPIPHYPLNPPPQFAAMYAGVDVSSDETAKNSFGEDGTRLYFGMISWLDSRVGELLSFLANKRALANTLIIYLTDNGAGIHGGKAHFSEAGMRTPIIANFPGRIPPTGLSPALVGEIDVYPTLMDWAGGPTITFPDARSFRALAEGTTTEWRKVFFNNLRILGGFSVRDARYKLYTDMFAEPKRVMDLQTDPLERHNLLHKPAGQDTIDRLLPVLKAWIARDWALLAQLEAAL
jgi:uncharacterized sulfatase